VNQPLSDIKANGVKVDPYVGLRFRLGAFPIDRSAEIVEALELRIALGVPQNFQPATLSKEGPCAFSDTAPKRSDLKTGFHSLCISPAGEYIVFNRAQVECIALVRFSGGDNLAESTANDNLCDVCLAAEATIWCVNDAAKLCDACDASAHGRNAVLGRHERLPLVDARALMEFCPEHGDRFEYYCRECHTSLCTKCKMAGSHSRGDKAEHVLVPIKKAYTEALEQMDAGDPTIAERRAVIVAKQEECEAMLQDVISNVEQLEGDIRQIVTDTITQECECADEKGLVIRSVQTELRRKLAEVVALEHSLEDSRRLAGPQAFLRAVTSQARIVARTANNLDLPLEVTAQGDVLVHGAAVLDPVLVRSRSRRSRCRSRGFDKISFAEIEQEVIELNRWIRTILPAFTD
jgi:hypothetical protein